MTERKNIAALLILALALAQTPARAESLGELQAPGLPLLPLDAQSLGLGGATEARWDLPSGLPANPAQMLALEGVTFSTVLQLRKASSDIGGVDWSETRQNFPAFQVSAALPRGLRFGVGFRADLRSRGSFDQGVDLGELSYTQSFSQEGGLHRFPLTLAAPIGERLRLGMGIALLKGNLKEEWWWHSFRDAEGLIDGSFEERRSRRLASWHGTSLVLGAQMRPRPGYAASLRWESPADLTGTSIRETAGEDDSAGVTLDGHMPGRWGAGLSLPLPGGGFASAQWDHEDWANWESPLATVELRSVDRFGFGAAWSLGRKSGPWGERRSVPLRFGVRFGDYPAPDPIGGGDVTERLIGLGSGFVIQDGRGAVDVTFFLQRLESGGREFENRWGLALSLRTSEIWQKRTQPF